MTAIRFPERTSHWMIVPSFPDVKRVWPESERIEDVMERRWPPFLKVYEGGGFEEVGIGS